MTAPRLEIRLDRIRHNAEVLVGRLSAKGISVTGVTKAMSGCPAVARELVAAGITTLGDSRIENIERMRAAGVTAEMILIRSPMPSHAARVVRAADTSLNTEVEVVGALSAAASAAQRRHGVVLMVELGDLREGILPVDLHAAVEQVLGLPHIDLRGIGTNLACQSGASPDARNMGELSTLATSIEAAFGIHLAVVSGGNSANLDWALSTADPGRIDDLRLGESILLGCETLERRTIPGLHTDAFALVAEVIESKVKPTQPWGAINQAAFGAAVATGDERKSARRVIVAIGQQDVDPLGLVPPEGMRVLGASSDHMVLDPGTVSPPVGAELRFGVDYSALLRAMTSPFVAKVVVEVD
ncbi:MAG: alanine/ornithine racemase family PLP-dependent enzyme [Acidimicrobiia bacterium]|nr:alanine/ornithine racemase family PLP-dependent enzyme [Acidimicrobiia bacterium]